MHCARYLPTSQADHRFLGQVLSGQADMPASVSGVRMREVKGNRVLYGVNLHCGAEVGALFIGSVDDFVAAVLLRHL